MHLVHLQPHPASPPRGVRSVQAGISIDRERATLRYRVEHAAPLALPSRRGRHHELWRHTCFELFTRSPGAASYCEFNFAPDAGWQAYRFASLRTGRQDLDMAPPQITARRIGDDFFELTVRLAGDALGMGRLQAALSAVTEELDGTKSYWALNHPNREKPDFHDPAGFILDLPAA